MNIKNINEINIDKLGEENTKRKVRIDLSDINRIDENKILIGLILNNIIYRQIKKFLRSSHTQKIDLSQFLQMLNQFLSQNSNINFIDVFINFTNIILYCRDRNLLEVLMTAELPEKISPNLDLNFFPLNSVQRQNVAHPVKFNKVSLALDAARVWVRIIIFTEQHQKTPKARSGLDLFDYFPLYLRIIGEDLDALSVSGLEQKTQSSSLQTYDSKIMNDPRNYDLSEVGLVNDLDNYELSDFVEGSSGLEHKTSSSTPVRQQVASPPISLATNSSLTFKSSAVAKERKSQAVIDRENEATAQNKKFGNTSQN